MSDMERARELHKPVIRKFKTRRIITRGIDHIWAIDLLVMDTYSEENRGFKYILNVIDCFSKFNWCVALKKKTAAEVSAAFEQILNTSKRRPVFLHSDRGKEFLNKTFKRLLNRYNIHCYQTFSDVKSSIVERQNRTLNEKLKLHFEVNQHHKWLWILPKILSEYNETHIHRTTGVPPAQVSKKNEREIYERMYPLEKFQLDKPTFNVNDRVRITRKRGLFDNKYSRKWTNEIFKVNKIHFTDPITYSITDLNGDKILGHFYKQELQRTNF